MANSPIGFFDSGVGGLSVYARLKKLLPLEDTIYFGDLKNLPYGNKSKEELDYFAANILDFFKTKNVKAVAIACNTSSALAYDSIKNNYDFKIYPIIQSCAKVISSLDISRIGVFATNATVNSGTYSREINRYNPNISVKEIACPNWVSIVESGNQFNKKNIEDIATHLDKMKAFNPDKIVLGCTHYPYLMSALTKFMPANVFIDPAKIFAEYIKNDLEKNHLLKESEGYEEFYVSANPEAFLRNSKLFYDIKKLPILVELATV